MYIGTEFITQSLFAIRYCTSANGETQYAFEKSDRQRVTYSYQLKISLIKILHVRLSVDAVETRLHGTACARVREQVALKFRADDLEMRGTDFPSTGLHDSNKHACT